MIFVCGLHQKEFKSPVFKGKVDSGARHRIYKGVQDEVRAYGTKVEASLTFVSYRSNTFQIAPIIIELRVAFQRPRALNNSKGRSQKVRSFSTLTKTPSEGLVSLFVSIRCGTTNLQVSFPPTL